MRRAKIVATWGPALASYENTVAVLQAGVDVARLNMSHGDYSMHAQSLANVRNAAAEVGRAVGIFADLQGPKIRLGRFKDDAKFILEVGEKFTITIEDIQGTRNLCSTTFKGLPTDVKPGDFLLINDGKVKLKALEVTDTEVRSGGCSRRRSIEQ